MTLSHTAQVMLKMLFCGITRIILMESIANTHLISLSPLTLEVVGAPQMTLQQYVSTLPCLQLLSGNLQTPFLSIL